MNRLPILGAILIVLVAAGGLADHGATSPSSVALLDAMPVAAPAGALSSSWFCAGPVSQPAHMADGQVVIANAGARVLHATVTLIPSQGSPVSKAVDVGANDRVVVPSTGIGTAPYLGAVVDLDGGRAAVEQTVSGTAGASTSACATSGSANWYFAAGTTQENSTLSVALLNPYPEDAIADLSFTTEQGQENPTDFQGIVIPARSLVGLDLGAHLRRRASIATTVKVRVGRVVAFQTQVVQPFPQGAAASLPAGATPSPPGVSLVLGAPSVATTAWWPDGLAGDGMTERYVMYNPGAVPAQLLLGVDLDQGSADPFQLTVDPHSVTEVVSNSESRVPKGIGHAAMVRSTNGVGVVAERVVQAASPSPHTGLARVPGSRLESRRWLLSAGAATATSDEWLAMYNPGSAPVTMSVSALVAGNPTALDSLGDVVIPPHHRVAARINDHSPGVERALLVEANGAVVVERDEYPAKGTGIDAALGVPIDR